MSTTPFSTMETPFASPTRALEMLRWWFLGKKLYPAKLDMSQILSALNNVAHAGAFDASNSPCGNATSAVMSALWDSLDELRGQYAADDAKMETIRGMLDKIDQQFQLAINKTESTLSTEEGRRASELIGGWLRRLISSQSASRSTPHGAM